MNAANRARDEAAAWGEILVLCEQLVNLRMPQGPDNSSQLTPAAPSPPELEGHCRNGFHVCRRCTLARECGGCRPCGDVRHLGLAQDHCVEACVLLPLAERPVPPPSRHGRPTPAAPRSPAPRRHTLYKVGRGTRSHYDGCVCYTQAIANHRRVQAFLPSESCPYPPCTKLCCKPSE
jgi:hypothetical protein